uniref:Uncharacterized protein n=1 Tax=Triticum urartu TaxID=4572 RepID=A0A8R7JUY3_TRIUA
MRNNHSLKALNLMEQPFSQSIGSDAAAQ